MSKLLFFKDVQKELELDTIKDAENILKKILVVITRHLSNGHNVSLRGFGQFKPRWCKVLAGFDVADNLKTSNGYMYKLLPKFKAGTKLKASVANGVVGSKLANAAKKYKGNIHELS